MQTDWQFDPQLLKQAEQRWPFPLASTCRALRVSTDWQAALRPLTHLYEVLLKYLAALCIVEYRHLPQTDAGLAQLLMHEAYRGHMIGGRLVGLITRLLPHLHQHAHQTQIPGLAALYTLADYRLEPEILLPLTQIRNRWSHAKDHVQYQPPRLEDFVAFRDRLSSLLAGLAFFEELHWFYPRSIKQQQGQTWAEGLLLEGATQPFEPARLPVLQVPDTDALGLYLIAAQKVLPLFPLYLARPAEAGQLQIAALAQFRKRRCQWEPEQDDTALAEAGYLAFMDAIALPDELPPPALPPQEITPATPSQPAKDPAPAGIPNSTPAMAPTFRNATWRMFDSDWQLQPLSLHNTPHYDALYQGAALWAVWRYAPGPNAYLLGLREHLLPLLRGAFASAPVRWLPACPPEEQAAFVPERRGHWHHGHFVWAWWPDQEALGAALELLARHAAGLIPPAEKQALHYSQPEDKLPGSGGAR